MVFRVRRRESDICSCGWEESGRCKGSFVGCRCERGNGVHVVDHNDRVFAENNLNGPAKTSLLLLRFGNISIWFSKGYGVFVGNGGGGDHTYYPDLGSKHIHSL